MRLRMNCKRITARMHTGTITIEGSSNQLLHEGGPVHHAGFLETWMDSVTFDRGEFYLVDFVGSDANGALNIAFQPSHLSMELEPGNTTVPLPACGGGSCIVDSRVVGPNFVWMRTHILSFDGYGAAFLSEISSGRSFDAAGIGYCCFSLHCLLSATYARAGCGVLCCVLLNYVGCGLDAPCRQSLGGNEPQRANCRVYARRPIEYVPNDGSLTFSNPHLKGNGSTTLDLTVTQTRQPHDKTSIGRDLIGKYTTVQ